MNQSTEQTTAQSDDTMFNIQRGCLTMWANDQGPHSTLSSPIDDASTPSECDYAKHVAAQNNMEVEVSHTSPPLDIPLYDFSLPFSQPLCVSNEEVLNPMSNSDTNMSMEPSPPTVIPYSANILADPSL